jgi:predicted GIY-YIG superfamily endonuclease
MKPSQNSLFKSDTYVRSVAESGILGLVHEITSDVEAAIVREKELKGWRRSKKVALIESMNPQWKDLSLEWYE